MLDNKIKDYIDEKKAEGMSVEEIREGLKKNGWDDSDIDGLVGSASQNHKLNKADSLPAHWDLFSRAFDVFRENFEVIFMVMLVQLGIWMVFGFGFSYVEDSIDIRWVIPFMLITFLVSTWGNIALIRAISNPGDGFVEAYQYALDKLWGGAYISFLVFAVILGGVAFFVLPGIVLGVQLMFALFIYLEEDIDGPNALRASSQLVYGNAMSVVSRVVFIMLLLIIIQIPLGFLELFVPRSIENEATLFLDYVTTLFVTPLVTVYMYLLYKSLRKVSVAGAKSLSDITLGLFGVLGLIILGLLLIGLLFVGEVNLI